MLYSEKETEQLLESRLETVFQEHEAFPSAVWSCRRMSICYVNHNAENETGTMAETTFGSGLLMC